ncbi:ANTAR domain-containing protein [Kribbella endophytica]
MDAGRAHAAGFGLLAMDLHNAPGLDETVSRALRFAHQVVPCDFAGLMLRDDKNRYHPVGVSDPRAAAAVELQVITGEGPWQSQVPAPRSILIQDTIDDPRWPRWGPRVAGIGLRSLLSIRLSTARAELGFLNFCSTNRGRLAVADNAVAYLLACHAAIAIDSAQQTATLTRAIEARTVVGQAQGILMTTFGMDATQAFAVLRRYSQDANEKLADVARRVIETRRLPVYRPAPLRTRPEWRPDGRRQYYDAE